MDRITEIIRTGIALVAIVALVSCAGGTSDNGMIIEGTLVQGEGSGHQSAALRHSSGEPIEEVSVCALTECSITDEKGHWGFAADENFKGGDIEFSINGHGIDTELTVAVPAASAVTVNFTRHTGNDITAAVVEINGVNTSTGH